MSNDDRNNIIALPNNAYSKDVDNGTVNGGDFYCCQDSTAAIDIKFIPDGDDFSDLTMENVAEWDTARFDSRPDFAINHIAGLIRITEGRVDGKLKSVGERDTQDRINMGKAYNILKPLLRKSLNKAQWVRYCKANFSESYESIARFMRVAKLKKVDSHLDIGIKTLDLICRIINKPRYVDSDDPLKVYRVKHGLYSKDLSRKKRCYSFSPG